MGGSIQQAGGGTIQFLTVSTDAGMIEDEPLVQSEEHTTPGIDGRRWRTVFKQFEPFALYTVVDAATYDAAIEIKRKATRFVQSLSTLKVTLDVVTYQSQKVHIDAVKAQCVPGPAIGTGATGLAHVIIVWQLTCTDFDA